MEEITNNTRKSSKECPLCGENLIYHAKTGEYECLLCNYVATESELEKLKENKKNK